MAVLFWFSQSKSITNSASTISAGSMTSAFKHIQSTELDECELLDPFVCSHCGAEYELYCKTCRKLICKTCHGKDTSHRYTYASSMPKYKQVDYLAPYDIRTAAQDAVDLKQQVVARISEASSKARANRIKVSQCKEMRKQGPNLVNMELASLTRISTEANSIEATLKTKAGRRAAVAVREIVSDAIASVSKELDQLGGRIEKLEERVELFEREAVELKQVYTCLKTICSIKDVNVLKQQEKLCLGFVADDWLPHIFCSGTCPSTYAACRHANRLTYVVECKSKELVSNAPGVYMSGPVTTKINLAGVKKGGLYMSVLTNGSVFIFASRDNGLTIHNILEDGFSQPPTMFFPRRTTLVETNNRILLLPEGGDDLRVANLREFTMSPASCAFATTLFPGITWSADTTLPPRLGEMYFANSQKKLCVLDMSSLETRELGPERVEAVASLTGVRLPSYRCVYTDSNAKLWALPRESDKPKLVADLPGVCLIVIPSAVVPDDLNRALLFCNGGVVMCGGCEISLGSLKYKGGISLARLYQDVFLMFDRASQTFVCVRIVVE